jgi:hypothetical protein
MLSSFESFLFDGTNNPSPHHGSESDDDLDLFPLAKPLQTPAAFSSSPRSSSTGPPPPPPEYSPPSYRTASEYRDLLLPRRIYDEKQPTSYRLARPGELIDEKGRPALLYDFWRTPPEALDEFGIGVSLYFRILRALIVLFGLCAVVSIVAMVQNQQNQESTNYLSTVGSAEANCLLLNAENNFPSSPSANLTNISTTFSLSSASLPLSLFAHSSVPVQGPSVVVSSFFSEETREVREQAEGREQEEAREQARRVLSSDQTNSTSTPHYLVYTPFRILGSVNGATVKDLLFYRQGISDMIITALLVFFTGVAGLTMRHQIQKIDSSQQTTKDYSIVITNPPPEIDDPQVTLPSRISTTS